jgi:hypothetical protein
MPESTLSPCQGLWISGWKFLFEDSVVGQHWFHVDPDAGICWTKFSYFTVEKFIFFFTCNIFIPRPQRMMSKLQEKPPVLKQKRPALKTKQFCFLFLCESFLPAWIQIWIRIPSHVQIWIQPTKINENPSWFLSRSPILVNDMEGTEIIWYVRLWRKKKCKRLCRWLQLAQLAKGEKSRP